MFEQEDLMWSYLEETTVPDDEEAQHFWDYIAFLKGRDLDLRKTGFRITSREARRHFTCKRTGCNTEVPPGKGKYCCNQCYKAGHSAAKLEYTRRLRAKERYDREMEKRLARYAEEDGWPKKQK